MWTDEGAIILKFFLTLDKEEQLKRFKDRQENVNKQWKITDEDWRNRENGIYTWNQVTIWLRKQIHPCTMACCPSIIKPLVLRY